eukprot:GEMP01090773.1.p1 GENE.GEMP01090773.1~~GEMP01090773.1.p1  ORF type:complete len:106 (+),score=9.56 GEMP01090773.1:489-806(+)
MAFLINAAIKTIYLSINADARHLLKRTTVDFGRHLRSRFYPKKTPTAFVFAVFKGRIESKLVIFRSSGKGDSDGERRGEKRRGKERREECKKGTGLPLQVDCSRW